MKDLIVSVKKLTDEDLMREACESTFLGKSCATLLDLYKAEHSPVRTQIFWITLKNVKLFISTHLLRHHVGSVPFQLTCRNDRPGGNPGVVHKCREINASLTDAVASMDTNSSDAKAKVYACMEEVEWLAEHSDRNTPVNLSLLVNAQALIDMAKLRLCTQAHKETRDVFQAIKHQIAQVDPALSAMMVRKCVYRGGLCGEKRCCGFTFTPTFVNELKQYIANFSNTQQGMMISENCHLECK